ncbi:hypothetical protein OESDEN_09253 [Oesophagostomum dentatum]|uniref:Uncharacterized protein n=1 Tax=Oesophagostomum dentatum TaxID=61180 RepID=A0A0B1T661_OESDE|nr:hypothetical protein OESDEN_09253 [Oesophagostomum dentatum]
MCVRRKNSVGSRQEKLNNRSSLMKSPFDPTPRSPTPPASPKTSVQVDEKPKEKELKSLEEIVSKQVEDTKSATNVQAPVKDDKSKEEPLHIQVPPPRIIKARRPMDEVRSPHDPEYKTLEPDNSEWESVRIMKRSELNDNGVEKKKPRNPSFSRVELTLIIKKCLEQLHKTSNLTLFSSYKYLQIKSINVISVEIKMRYYIHGKLMTKCS